MKIKILVLALVLIATIGFVAADDDVDILSLKAPQDFQAFGDDGFKSNSNGLEILIEDFDGYEGPDADDIDIEDNGFKNVTGRNYTVVPGEVNNTFNLDDGNNHVKGCIELVEINGHRYAVTFWGMVSDNDDELMENATETLKEFNKLNDLKPIEAPTS